MMTEDPEDGYICSICGARFPGYTEWFGHSCYDERHMLMDLAACSRRLARFSFEHPPFPIEMRVEQELGTERGQLTVHVTVDDVCGREGRIPIACYYPFSMPIHPQAFDEFVELAIVETYMHELYETTRLLGKRIREPHRPDGSQRMFSRIAQYTR